MLLHKTYMNLDPSHLPVSLQYYGFTYLGIQITTTVAQIVKDNFNPALIKVKKDQMNILPRNNFLFSKIPLSLSTVSFFKRS